MRRSKATKAVALIITVIMMASVVMACGTAKETQPNAGTSTATTGNASTETTAAPSSDEPGWKKDTSPVTLSWFITESYVKYAETWGKDVVSKMVTEKTGINIEWIVPAGDGTEVYKTMIASDSLPDMVTGLWSGQETKQAITAGQLLSLNKLADQYDPYFLKVADPLVLAYFKKPDGNTYQYPCYAASANDMEKYKGAEVQLNSNEIFRVRKDIYEAIGKPDMRTPEGFLDALKAAKEKFPTVDGKPLIPFCTMPDYYGNGSDGLSNYLCDFLAIPYVKGGQVYDRKSDPEYLRWMKTFRKAAEMKLISPDFFTDNEEKQRENEMQGRYFAMLRIKTDNSVAYYTQNPDKAYIAIDGPANSKLDPPTLSVAAGLGGWLTNSISKNCKSPDRAIKFLSYVFSEEGAHDFYFGKKGVTWDTIDGKDQFLPAVMEEMKKDGEAAGAKYGTKVSNPYYEPFANWAIFMQWMPPVPEPLLGWNKWTYGKQYMHSESEGLYPPSDIPAGIANDKIDKLTGKTFPKLIFAKSDTEFDQIFNDYVQQRAALGFDEVMEYETNKYLEQCKLLGIEVAK